MFNFIVVFLGRKHKQRSFVLVSVHQNLYTFSMNSLPSGTVTFLFTDIEGSTKLALDHPDQWESLRARHHAILQSAMDMHKRLIR
jgi:class 3 adenylate cyclase